MINVKQKPSTFGYGEVLRGKSKNNKFDFSKRWNRLDRKISYKSSIKEI